VQSGMLNVPVLTLCWLERLSGRPRSKVMMISG
jgi:hypothetical protein